MRKNKNKKNIFFRKSSWLLIVIFIATLITIPAFNTRTEAAAMRPGIVSNKFKILNIDPGAKNFTIGSGTDRTYIPGDIIDGRSVEVTRISMAEFNSMVDEVKGQYDAVVIGRNKTSLIKDFSYDHQYRDYSSPFYQEFTELNVNGNRMNTSNNADIRNKIKYSAASNDSALKYSGEITDSTKKTFIEYYSENDITKKRAREIKAMLDGDVNGNGKELVYIASEIFSDDDLKASNLYNEFNSYNTAKVPQNSINLSKIKDDYENRDASLKRPNVTKLAMSEDDRNITNVENVNISTRDMEYFLTIPNGDELKVSLYLDFDGNGVFNKDQGFNERIIFNVDLKNYKVPNTADEYKIIYKMDSTFVGYLNWKIDISKPNGVKTYINGDTIFKAIPGKEVKITVLQIFPKTNTDGKNLYLNKDDNGTTVQKRFSDQVALDAVKKSGYILDIDPISCDDFNNEINNNSSYLDNYDMIIVGFSDNYGDGANKRSGYSNQFTQKSVDAIEAFINSKKAVMLTHDTITLNTFGDTYMGVGPKLLGKELRDYVGQARYADVYRNGDEREIGSDTNIIHDSLIPAKTAGADKYKDNNNLTSMGATLYINQFVSTETNTVRIINNAQITKYPFDLSEKNTMPVAKTHTQWYQLNLEDPEVVPWYNISNGSKFDAGDSRNFYYTYSKGNITYSGTGHSNDGSYSDDELQLFVNTIIKAARGANNPPSITNYTPSGYLEQTEITTGSTVSPSVQRSSDYDFISVPFDIDKDGMKVTVKAIGINSNGVEVNSKIVYSDNEYNKYLITNPISGLDEKAKLDTKIPRTLYENNKDVTKVRVETTVEDSTGAIATNNFYIEISSNQPPTIINKYLNHDEIGNGVKIPDGVYKTLDYDFITLPTDPEDGRVKVTIKANDQNVNEVNADGTLGAIITDLEKDIDKYIRVRIPKEAYGNSSEVTVTTTVTDKEGAFDKKTFILKINQPPILSHSIVEVNPIIDTTNNEIINEPTYFDGTKNVIYFRKHDFQGEVSKLFNNTETVFLTLDPNIKLKSDITIYEIDSKGDEISLGTMVRNGETSTYSYVLNFNRTLDIPDNGIQIKVKYKAEIFNLPTTEGQTYTNVLSVGDFKRPLIIRSRQSDFVPDLF